MLGGQLHDLGEIGLDRVYESRSRNPESKLLI